ncbi:MAG TPA: pitrilysin family protein [Planctomycetaceae bacterium]|nr:pitrilysin family protein [Planctomycetaceae bacterium]
MEFKQTQLDNGLQIVAELNPFVHSMGIGFFVRTGSRDETAEVSGVSHFLEHMAFKGFGTYTAEDINRLFDDVGAMYNASTSEEVTQYYAAILPEYLPQTFELLAGILFPTLLEADFNLEKKVIQEEIGMYADMPGFTVYEKSMEAHFAGHPLGQSILGTHDSIEALTVEQMRNYHAEHYRAGNITLAIAGNTSWEEILTLAGRYCSHWDPGSHDRPTFEAKPQPRTQFLQQPIQQEHVMLVLPAPPADSELRYAADMLAMIIGDDTGSRMYWDIVDPAYADSADFGYSDYDGSGVWMSYLACAPEDVADNLRRFEAILDDVTAGGVTENELEQARNKLSSRIVLGGERPMERLGALGANWVYRHEYQSVEDDLALVQAITQEDLRNLIKRYPLRIATTYGLGPLEGL